MNPETLSQVDRKRRAFDYLEQRGLRTPFEHKHGIDFFDRAKRRLWKVRRVSGAFDNLLDACEAAMETERKEKK